VTDLALFAQDPKSLQKHLHVVRPTVQTSLQQPLVGIGAVDAPAERAGIAQCDDATHVRRLRRELAGAEPVAVRLETKRDAALGLYGVERVHGRDTHVRLQLVLYVARFVEVPQPLDVDGAHAARPLEAPALDVHPVRVGKQPHRHRYLEVLVAGHIGLYPRDTNDGLGNEQEHDRRGNREHDLRPECAPRGGAGRQ